MKKKHKKNYKNIGILGGTFDPPHLGHLHISKIALKKLHLNNLFWIVTKQNPLKNKPFLETKIRVKLSKNITQRQKKISVHYLDEKIKSKNTLNLLIYLKKKDKKANFFFIMGADNFSKLHSWKNWRKIPKYAKIVVFPRENYSGKARNSIASKKLSKKDWMYINSKKVNISSSLIRKFW